MSVCIERWMSALSYWNTHIIQQFDARQAAFVVITTSTSMFDSTKSRIQTPELKNRHTWTSSVTLEIRPATQQMLSILLCTLMQKTWFITPV